VNKPPKILFIDRRFTPTGGAQCYLDNLVLHCANAGYDVELAANSHPNIQGNYAILREAGVLVSPTPLGEKPPGLAAKWYKAFIAKSNPALIHVNTSCRELRQVLTRIGHWKEMQCKRVFTMHLSILSEQDSMNLGKRYFPWSYRSRTLRERRKFLEIFDCCISVSKENGNRASGFFDFPLEKMKYIPNGVDITKYYPENSAPNLKCLQSNRLAIGCCARLSKQKRLDVLIHAVAGLSSEHDVVLRLAGDGPERTRLTALARELGMADRIEFLGTQNDVCSFLQSLDLFVLTSDREGLPYALLEAMAVGLPAIVTNVNEMPFVVRDGVDGFVIPTEDVNACQEKIRMLIDNPELRARLGNSARERVCEQYNEASCLEKTLAVFDSLVHSQIVT